MKTEQSLKKRSVTAAFKARLFVGFATLLMACPSQAALLNWGAAPGNTWTAGSLSNSFNVDGVAGNDITITVTTSAGSTLDNSLGTQSPFAGSNANIGSGTNALLFSSSGLGPTNAHTVTVTITFTGTYAAGVYAGFTLFDVDKDTTFTDQIRNISAQQAGGGTVGLTLSGSANNTISGSGTVGATATGTNPVTDHSADVHFSSGATKITSLTFTWSNPDTTSGQQYIGLSNILFVTTPEAGSGMAALVLCCTMVGTARYRSRVVQKC